MADVAGLVVGGVALASLFTTCVDCFEYVQLGRKFGKNYQTCLLKLNIVRLRLSRWGESVRIVATSNPAESVSRHQLLVSTENDVEVVKTLLGEILLAFEDAEKLSERFKSKAKGDEVISLNTTANHDNDLDVLRTNMRDLALRRQKRTSLAQKAAWALYEERQFNRLIEDVTRFVNDLVDLFPANKEAQQQLCSTEISEIVGARSEQRLAVLKDVSVDIDETLEGVVTEAIEAHRGHSFKNVQASGEARMANGDEVAVGAQVTGYGHSYDGISASDKAKVFNGNRYGGNKGFWDDWNPHREAQRQHTSVRGPSKLSALRKSNTACF
ncbi:hypothetical protein MMC12_002464 [Toensbergia leucococca]|nr:hypothetical protein [Toensbergia leucococca]